LSSLVHSIEHVIMIGDPKQLRPTISNYGMLISHRDEQSLISAALSVDHPRGKAIYKFDQSTMERMSIAGMPMSKLSVQRRMRPEISKIARSALRSTFRFF
jgi:superfamily I DNA and/or RNA helicase